MPIVGIDLGTTNSLIACFKDTQPTVIPNVFGEYLTPSVVSVDDNGEIYIGRIAKERLVSHPLLTASVFKRTMGSQKQYKLGSGTFSSEELSSFIIKKLKEDAENFLGAPVTEAVISVPAYFNDAQRRATKYAGELAGLKVERIVNEPTAASLAHGFHEAEDYAKYIVFDLGGGTFDVSILEKYDSVMEVRAVAGDTFLGGEDFTHVLMRIFARKARLDLTSLSEIQRAILQKNIESSKCAFSDASAVIIRHILAGETYEAEVTLNEFSRECDELLSRLRIPVKKALTDASLSLSGIDNIVLVGGATKLPIIQSFVKKLFKRFPSYAVDPEQAVAIGTAIHAALKERNQAVSEIVLTDVCPFTLGVETVSKQASGIYYSDLYSPIIERNTVIPVSRVERYSTLHDNQPDIHCKILQGESHRASDNVFLGELTVPVPKAPAGQEAADVRFTYDINGILEVEVTIVSTGIKKKLIIEKNPGALTQEEIKQRLENLADYKIHPRDKEEYRLLLSRAERLYQESLGDTRQILSKVMLDFNIVLDTQENRKIRDHAVAFKAVLDEIELNI